MVFKFLYRIDRKLFLFLGYMVYFDNGVGMCVFFIRRVFKGEIWVMAGEWVWSERTMVV